MEDREQWHLDKRVPIALIFAILIQSVAAVWWAASISERVQHIEERQVEVRARASSIDAALTVQAQRSAVLAEAVSNTNTRLGELQDNLERTNTLLRQVLLNGHREATP